ncbi:hydroxyisourate hydrolase [Sphaerotilus mobilis]|uniref:5-hydroxyisourate hydrolase n=1 Tax=Sphaerotilus mobilis TaxID=47994 RepID=A0A4Q7LK19_9BURK|nr:hydroxyisourate hydrolase [Sphaerotilus mobilis]RZS54995.1 5-hydroxyisourate hydrolase [Sphaerotilus mobilis]
MNTTVAPAGGISLHAVDVARGVPAQGLLAELWLLPPEADAGAAPRCIAAGPVGANGQLDHPCVRGEGIVAGLYEARFHVGAHLREAVGPQASPFLDVVPFRFRLTEVAQHVHLPFKFTPWGYSLFRGV